MRACVCVRACGVNVGLCSPEELMVDEHNMVVTCRFVNGNDLVGALCVLEIVFCLEIAGQENPD